MSDPRISIRALVLCISAAAVLAGCADPTFRMPFADWEDTDQNPLGTAPPEDIAPDAEADALLFNDQAPVRSTKELDGVLVEVLRPGSGAAIGREDAAILRYRALLDDGTLIDESTTPRGPWPLPGMVEGLREGLVGAAVGDVRRITVAASKGYGDKPMRAGATTIPADATVVYTIHLVGIVPAAEMDEQSEPTPDE